MPAWFADIGIFLYKGFSDEVFEHKFIV